MRVTSAFLAVTDQEAAKRFYTDVLGFTESVDHRGDGFRWLSLTAAGEEPGAELVLTAALPEELRVMEVRRERTMPAFSFTVDGPAEIERIRRAGARFLSEPQPQAYGGTDALVDDTVGNIICLHQD